VYFPEEAFHQVRNVRVPTFEVLTRALTDPGVQELGPYDNAEQGTEVVTTSFMMYLPPVYVARAMAQPSLTPRQAWDLIGGPIINDPNLDLASDLTPY
jgi:hypothetical protein